jgi:hypothetical protein
MACSYQKLNPRLHGEQPVWRKGKETWTCILSTFQILLLLLLLLLLYNQILGEYYNCSIIVTVNVSAILEILNFWWRVGTCSPCQILPSHLIHASLFATLNMNGETVLTRSMDRNVHYLSFVAYTIKPSFLANTRAYQDSFRLIHDGSWNFVVETVNYLAKIFFRLCLVKFRRNKTSPRSGTKSTPSIKSEKAACRLLLLVSCLLTHNQ